MTTYNIINKSKEILSNSKGELLEDLTIDEVIEYKIANITKVHEFDIVECPNPSKDKKERKSKEKSKKIDKDELKNEFIKNLLPAQYSDLSNGVKELHWNGKNWGLKRIQEAQEIHISVMEVKVRDEQRIKQGLRLFILNEYREDIMDEFINDNPEITEEQFDLAFNSLLKS